MNFSIGPSSDNCIPLELYTTVKPAEKSAYFLKSIKRMELLLGKQNEAIDLQKKSDPCLLFLAGTRISYAKHLASEEQYDEAIEQIKKAQVIYDQIDFAQLANQSHSKVAFLNNCVQLIKEYQSIK